MMQDVLEALDDLEAAARAALHVLQATAIRDGNDLYWESGGGFETTKALRAAIGRARAHLT